MIRRTTWHRSSRSDSAGGNCVEARICDYHSIAVRDSKFIQGGLLTPHRTAWTSLLTGIKAGDFDS